MGSFLTVSLLGTGDSLTLPHNSGLLCEHNFNLSATGPQSIFQIPFCCKPQSLGSLHIQDKDRYLSDGDGLAASGGFFFFCPPGTKRVMPSRGQ